MTSNEDIRDTLKNLRKLLIERDSYAYATGYLESFLYDIIADRVSLEKRELVMEDIEWHIQSLKEKANA